MNRPTCETCPFWDAPVFLSSSGPGRCRHDAPTLGPEPFYQAMFPPMFSTGFCGEHPGFQAYLDESKKPDSCAETWLNARCMLAKGHDGNHEYHHRDLDREPSRCPVFVKGERCGKQAGHEGKHVWDRGD